MLQILASGDEIGNHTFDHPHYPGFGELASTDQLIRRATGFEPCLFRPPYGLLDGAVEGAAVGNHDARPGSIILMHDGGRHPQTVRALPGVIEGLENRGFELATVPTLLGGRMIYRPQASRLSSRS